jgi:hypothetical protein
VLTWCVTRLQATLAVETQQRLVAQQEAHTQHVMAQQAQIDELQQTMLNVQVRCTGHPGLETRPGCRLVIVEVVV